MRVLVTPTFERTVKKLHKQQKVALDEAVRTIVGQPEVGETKVGDLAGVQVYKFRMGNWVFRSNVIGHSGLS
jgi:mRNA interferase RelE/StbE